VAALDKWVRWALYEGRLEREPFRYADKQVMTPQGLRQVRVNAELESDRQSGPVRFVSYEDYLLWRNVGLRGELPDGAPDPTWRGRHAERNAAFADVLMSTGMRLGEAASLLVCEVPPRSGDRGFGGVHLSAAVTKRNKPRTVFMTRRTLRAVHHYIEIERDAVVQRQLSMGGYAAAADVVTVRGTGRLSLALADGQGSWPLSKIDPGQRARLRRLDGADGPGEPLWLWLGRDGLPLRPATWSARPLWCRIVATVSSNVEAAPITCSPSAPSRSRSRYQPVMSSAVKATDAARAWWRRSVSANGTSR
jgi:hypothetical protein